MLKNIKNKIKPSFWVNYYKARNLLFRLKFRHRYIIALVFIVALFLSCFYFAFNNSLKLYFILPEHVNGLKTLLVALCAAILGASVITFSFIIFAMQTNMKRMPYGLFRKFSSDRKLLICFIMIFILSIVTGCLSMLPIRYLATTGMLGIFWSIIFTMILLLAAYKRALKLINPVEQLSILTKDTDRNLEIWGKAATRLAPLLTRMKIDNSEGKAQNNLLDTGYDAQRAAYFALNPQWTLVSKQAVQYAFSLARYHAEQGDYEISRIALDTVAKINSKYISVKGKTFLFEFPLFNIPNHLDSFIQDTLELLRQNLQIGITSGDEQRITQLLEAFKNLCLLYLNIDYSTKFPAKCHANLASAYLADAVEFLLPHKMIDVFMNGLRMLGDVSLQLIDKSDVNTVTTISGKISLFSCACVLDSKAFPIIQTGVHQIAKITFSLLKSKTEDVGCALKQINGDINFIAKMILNVPDNQTIPFHSSSLNYYYSSTNTDSLFYWLKDLANVILEADADNEDAKRVTRHMAQWSNDLYQKEKELLLLAIENKSPFTIDILHWIVHLTDIFLAISKAQCCTDHFATEIEKNALWLICTLSWLPDEEEKLKFAENYQLTNLLFQSSIDASKHGCDDVASKIFDLLLSWTFKAGKYETYQYILEKGCYGLACLNLRFKMNNSVLCNAIASKLGKDCVPSKELLKKASQAIKDKAKNLPTGGYVFDEIESAMAQVDSSKMQQILVEVADALYCEIS